MQVHILGRIIVPATAKTNGFHFVIGFNHGGAKGGDVKKLNGLVPYELFCKTTRSRFSKTAESDLVPGALHLHMTCQERSVADTLQVLAEHEPVSFIAVEIALQEEGESIAKMIACFMCDETPCLLLFEADRSGRYTTRWPQPDELIPIRIPCLTTCRLL